MTDITLTPAPDQQVLYAEANTPEGEDFIDAYVCADLQVVDVGRIIVPTPWQGNLEREAREAGCTTEVVPYT